jgi:hypothetical protein
MDARPDTLAPTSLRPTDGAPETSASLKLVEASPILQSTALGFKNASAAERGTFGILCSFALTIGISRAINYGRERRRTAPRLRSWARRVSQYASQDEARIHHFLPGIVLTSITGAAAILMHHDGREVLLGLPFGVGVGLTSDEIAILAELDNPYWRSEKLSILQATAAGIGVLALAVRFHHHGKAREAPGAGDQLNLYA